MCLCLFWIHFAFTSYILHTCLQLFVFINMHSILWLVVCVYDHSSQLLVFLSIKAQYANLQMVYKQQQTLKKYIDQNKARILRVHLVISLGKVGTIITCTSPNKKKYNNICIEQRTWAVQAIIAVKCFFFKGYNHLPCVCPKCVWNWHYMKVVNAKHEWKIFLPFHSSDKQHFSTSSDGNLWGKTSLRNI